MTRLRRVSPSQTTKDSIIVPHNTKGQPVDPNTWEPLVKGQIDVGHNYQFEERVMRKAAERVNMSQADYSKMMNDPKLYRLETAATTALTNLNVPITPSRSMQLLKPSGSSTTSSALPSGKR